MAGSGTIAAVANSIICLIGIVLVPLAVSATTITVDTSADNTTAGDAQCTLREAIANVNAAADTTGGDCGAGSGVGDTVIFDLALPAKIVLTLGQLAVAQDVSIVGPTIGSLRISAARASRVLHITAGATSVSNLTIERGKAETAGSGIFNEGTLTLSNCTLKGNKNRERSFGGGGGIDNRGVATLTDCTLEGNMAPGGAGISNTGMMTLTNCTLVGNRSGQGGGINNGGTLTLTNCTLRGNKARYGAGGGILNIGTVTLVNSTLEHNKAFAGRGSLGGGGILHFSVGGGTATLTNTIISNSGKGRNCGGDPITSAGHNLSSDDTCFTSGGTDVLNTNPLLAPLANYGGPTKTMALCSAAGTPHRSCTGTSPAIDAADDAVTGAPDNLTTDQRGLPRNAGSHVDIGAFEVQ